MRYFNILLVFFVTFFTACGQEMSKKSQDEVVYTSYGAKFTVAETINSSEIFQKYSNLRVSDTLQTNFTATVKEVCQAKGCWMKLELKDGNEAMVRFKDYGFFMPTDIAGKEVIVNGKAFVSEMSVADQRHYAEDAGANTTTIKKINKPKKTYSFLADGVVLKR